MTGENLNEPGPPKDVVFILACFNEATNVPHVFADFGTLWRTLNARLIIVDDGSDDGTPDIVRKMGALHGVPVRLICLSRNFGKELALQAAIQACGDSSICVVMDSDGQHTVQAVQKLLDRLSAGDVDFAFGVRRTRDYQSPFARLASVLLYKLINFAQPRYRVDSRKGDFFACNRTGLGALKQYISHHPFWKGYYAYMGLRQADVEIEIRSRITGESKFRLKQLVWLAVEALSGFAVWPLRLVFGIGVVAFISSLVLSFALILQYAITGQEAGGFYSLGLLICGFGGVQVASIGILAEYFLTAATSIRGLPKYVVASDERINNET